MAKKDFKFELGSIVGMGRGGDVDDLVWWDIVEISIDGPGIAVREHGTDYKVQWVHRSLVQKVQVDAYVDDAGKVVVMRSRLRHADGKFYVRRHEADKNFPAAWVVYGKTDQQDFDDRLMSFTISDTLLDDEAKMLADRLCEAYACGEKRP